MRISDWSSDVCSSDLQPLRITFEDLPIFVDRGRSRDLSPCRYGHLDISWRSTRSKGERSRSCKLRPEKCRKPMPVKAGGGFPSIVPGVRDRCARLLRLIPGRSEERREGKEGVS